MPLLNGTRYLAEILDKDVNSGLLFRKIISAINQLGKQIGADPVGKTAAPPPINSITVKGTQTGSTITCPGELLHFTLNHSGKLTIGTHYYAEVATEPSFSNPHVIDMGASRTHTTTLPTFLDDGETTQSYYLRAYPQSRGSDPQKPTVLGGVTGALQINMSGTTAATLLPSTGSGTAPTNGSRGGSGMGKTLVGVPAVVPKRSVAVQRGVSTQ